MGRRIVAVRALTDVELAENGWARLAGSPPVVGLFLDDGSYLVASENPLKSAANRRKGDYRPGTLLGVNARGDLFQLLVPEVVTNAQYDGPRR